MVIRFGIGPTHLPPTVQKIYNVVSQRQSFSMDLNPAAGISLPCGNFQALAAGLAPDHAGKLVHQVTVRKSR